MHCHVQTSCIAMSIHHGVHTLQMHIRYCHGHHGRNTFQRTIAVIFTHHIYTSCIAMKFIRHIYITGTAMGTMTETQPSGPQLYVPVVSVLLVGGGSVHTEPLRPEGLSIIPDGWAVMNVIH